jgi:tRNA G18 (ribose-2'-O)-methylase SpoU
MLSPGNEGQGVRPKVLEQCDALVKIPSLGPSMVDSLNVSAATAVLLYQVLAPTLATQKP